MSVRCQAALPSTVTANMTTMPNTLAASHSHRRDHAHSSTTVDTRASARQIDGSSTIAYTDDLAWSSRSSNPAKMNRLDHTIRSPGTSDLRLRQATYTAAGQMATVSSNVLRSVRVSRCA